MTNMDMGAKPDMTTKVDTGSKTNSTKVDSNAKIGSGTKIGSGAKAPTIDAKPKASPSAKPADSQVSKTGAEGSVKVTPKPATMTTKPGVIASK